MVFNLLDYPSLVMPISKVDPEVDVVKPRHEFYDEVDKANHEICEFLEAILGHSVFNKPLDNPANFVNAPISVQLVGRTLEEEAVIAMGEIVDAALKAGAQQ